MRIIEFLTPDNTNDFWEYSEEEGRLINKNDVLVIIHWDKMLKLETSKFFTKILTSPILAFYSFFFFPSSAIANFYKVNQYDFIGPIPKKECNESIFHSGRQYFLPPVSKKYVHSYINMDLVHKKKLPYIFSKNKFLPKNIRRPKIFDFREYQYHWYEKYRYIFLAQELDPDELTIYYCY